MAVQAGQVVRPVDETCDKREWLLWLDSPAQ